jgi:copper(I)-binding protein
VSPLRRRAAFAALAAVATPAIAACGAGNDAVSVQPYAPGDGVAATSADSTLRVLNAIVVAPPEGSGDAVISLTIADRTEDGDELIGMSAGEAGQVQYQGSQEVPPRGTLTLGPGQTPGGEKSQALIADLQAAPGDIVPLQLMFRDAGMLEIRTVVAPAEGYYEEYVAPAATTAPSTPVAPATPAEDVDGQVDVESTPEPTAAG